MANKCVAPKCESNYNELQKKKEKKKDCRSNPRKRNVYHFPTEPCFAKNGKMQCQERNGHPRIIQFCVINIFYHLNSKPSKWTRIYHENEIKARN